MKMQKFVAFIKKILKVNMLKIRNIVKLGTTVIKRVNTQVLHIAYII